jgi:hypothetical protein
MWQEYLIGVWKICDRICSLESFEKHVAEFPTWSRLKKKCDDISYMELFGKYATVFPLKRFENCVRLTDIIWHLKLYENLADGRISYF